MQNPRTRAGIEPATFRFVAQRLDHCATAVPFNLSRHILSRTLKELHLGWALNRLRRWQIWVPGLFLGIKGSRGVGLLTLLYSCDDCLEIWEPQTPETYGSVRGLYGDFFACMITKHVISHLIIVELLIISGLDSCKVKAKVTLEHATKTQRRSRGIALHFP